MRQVIRYGIVGIINNLLGYLIYLGVTWLGVDPKLAITLLYPIGATTAYFGHARFSFANQGHPRSAAIRYVAAHLIGYATNFMLLLVFHDLLGIPHAVVQGIAIFVVAGVLFLLFKFVVFALPADGHARPPV